MSVSSMRLIGLIGVALSTVQAGGRQNLYNLKEDVEEYGESVQSQDYSPLVQTNDQGQEMLGFAGYQAGERKQP